MEINLTSDIEQALKEQAKRQGTTPEQLALESLRRQFVYPTQTAHSVEEPALSAVKDPGTLADFIADFIGVLHSGEHIAGGARMSETTGETFAKALVEKRKQGRL